MINNKYHLSSCDRCLVEQGWRVEEGKETSVGKERVIVVAVVVVV